MRELISFEKVPLDPNKELGSQLMAIASSDAFKKSEEYFAEYPPNSLLASRMRAFLNVMILALKPELVLEIGTYRAGTSEVIARSLWAAGKGKLVTIDPHGVANGAPNEIDRWPSELQSIVQFYPQMSKQFFEETAKTLPQKFDVIFIDSNHDYEFVRHDIVMSANFLKPGGVMVLDNAEQPGVLWAAREFFSHNPGWTEATGVLGKYTPSDPFRMTNSPINSLVSDYEGWMGFVLIAPKDRAVGKEQASLEMATEDSLTVGERPISYQLEIRGSNELSGIVLKLAKPTTRGRLHLKIYLRTFAKDTANETFLPEELLATCSQICHPGVTEIVAKLKSPLRSQVGSVQSIRKCELFLSWQSLERHKLWGLIPLSKKSSDEKNALKLAHDPLPSHPQQPV